jgi:hypothetical protein
MAKIILSTGTLVLREIALAKERITIGRGPHNDIVINEGAISAEHAVIVTTNDDSYLEDLNSTNGTQVNGQPVRKHFLQDGDVLELPGYRIAYTAQDLEDSEGSRSTVVGNPGPSLGEKRYIAGVRIMNGPNAGKEIFISKMITTLGRPDTQVVVVAKRSQEYYLTHVYGPRQPCVNGKPLGSEALEIADGDVIDLSGVNLQFFVAHR